MDDEIDDADECAPDCDERAQCPDAGTLGHLQCGYCQVHARPAHHCSPQCWVPPRVA